MATRGTRNTTIAFGGFEIAVAMKKAAGSRDLKLETVDADGEKVTAPRASGGTRGLKPGQSKAVRVGDQPLRIPAEALERIEQESKDAWESMQVIETIDYRQVPTERIAGSYWLQPAQGSAKGLALLAAALRETGKVAVVKWISTSREKLGVIRVRGAEGSRALLLSELVFANDFLEADADALEINAVDVDERALAVATNLIESFAREPGAEPAVDTASDTAVDARLALFERLMEQETARQLEASVSGADGAQDGGELIDLDAARGRAA